MGLRSNDSVGACGSIDGRAPGGTIWRGGHELAIGRMHGDGATSGSRDFAATMRESEGPTRPEMLCKLQAMRMAGIVEHWSTVLCSAGEAVVGGYRYAHQH
jgi:hypothetical protein